MKVSILDDYHDTLRTLDCFKKLKSQDVEIWNDHVQDVDALSTRLTQLGDTHAGVHAAAVDLDVGADDRPVFRERRSLDVRLGVEQG